MKILMMTDLEGVAGVVSFADQTYADGKYYEAAKRLLTAEVNAAVDAAMASGATEVLVFDAHGPGAIYYPELHDAATLMHGRPLCSLDVRHEVFREYDVAMMVGQHAMAGAARGNLNHTQNSRSTDYIKLNGVLIGEIAQFALQCGALGMPLIFLSGDDVACREAEATIQGITTAAVKTGLSRNSAISLSIAQSHRLIREGVSEALAKQAKKPIAPFVWDGPFTFERRFFQNDIAAGYPASDGWDHLDSQTVAKRSDNILDIIYA
jgi:D-amino peptidase